MTLLLENDILLSTTIDVFLPMYFSFLQRVMNSKQLKERFKKTYESFFQKNQIVISAPFLMNRAWDISKEYSGITIKQKIPLRLYIGISKSNTKKILINDISYYDKTQDEFITTNALEYAPHFYNLNDHINSERKAILDIYDGINIDIFSELPRWMGLWFESILAFLLATGLNRLVNKIDHSTIDDINNLTIEDALKREDQTVSNWLKDGIIFDKIVFGTIISSVKRSSLFESYYPIISIIKDQEKQDENVLISLNKSYTFRFNELFEWWKKIPYLPIDYGIIYSGKPVLLEQIVTCNKKNGSYNDAIKPEFKNIFWKYFDNLKDAEIPKFYKDLIDTDNNKIESSLYGKVMGMLSIKIFHLMIQLYSREYNEEIVKEFIWALNKFRRWNYVTKNSSNFFMDIVRKLTEEFKANHSLFWLFPNDTTIMGGTIWFALPLEWFRKNFLNAVEETKKEFNGTDLIYCSWTDGIEHKWLYFEQDIEKNIYSEFIDSRKHILKSSDGQCFLWDYEELLEKQIHNIVLDCINDKIFVNGKKVTSDSLHSQSATIGILKILIENIGKEVHNKELPASWYCKNKNEMTGKIILPLIKLIEKEIGKKIPLICKWSIYEFYIKLNHSDITIAIIDRINDN